MDITLFESLLATPEGGLVDFKTISYQFSKHDKTEDGNFAKDIISFSNTIRSETAYIIAGVKLDGAKKILVGYKGILDDAILQQKLEHKVYPRPVFKSYPFDYQGMEFGIIEIPVNHYELPLRATQYFKPCDAGVIYIRRGSSNSPADHQEAIDVHEWMKALAGAKHQPLPTITPYEAPDVYIERTVSPADSDPLSYFFQDGMLLREIIKTHQKVALLGWGLSGKSTELKKLAHELSTTGDVYTFLIPLGNHTNESIESRIPGIEGLPPNKIIVLLDGMDELLPTNFEEARRKISQFTARYPNATIVVSCRTNFYTTGTDENGLTTLTDFDSYRLNDLRDEKIQSYLDEFDPKNKMAFLNEVREKKVMELLATPYYLVKLSRQFKNLRKIADNKADLFEEEITELIKKDVAKSHPSAHELFEKRLTTLFKRLAFIMEARGVNFIRTDELSSIFPKNDDLKLVVNAASIFYGTDTEQKTWKFNHNNTQEFLAAKTLSELPLKKIRQILGIGPDYNSVKPSWVNTLSFLNSILSPDDPLKKKITNWLIKHNRELVVMLEPERTAPDVRYKTFRTIFNDYKCKGRRINRTIYRPEDLAKFSESPEVFDFLLKSLRSEIDPVTINNALEVINFYPLKKYSAYQPAFKALYKKFLFGKERSLHYLALTGYAVNFTLTPEEFKAVFEKFKDDEDTWIRFTLFQAIWLSGHQEQMIGYVLEQAKILIREDRRFSNERNKKTRLSNEYSEIAKCLDEVKSAPALVTLFTELEQEFVSFAHSTHFEKPLKNLLENAEKYPENNELTARISVIFLANHGYILHNNRLKIAFLKYYRNTNGIPAILDALYAPSKLNDFSAGHSIAALATPEFIDFLQTEFRAGSITYNQVDTLQRFMETTANPNEPYFRGAFNIPDAAAIPLRDFKAETETAIRRNLVALFDKTVYLAEVEKIFTVFGKTTLTYEDSHSHSDPDYWGTDFIEVARDALGLRPQDPDVVLDVILEQINLYFDRGFVTRIYHYLLRHVEAELSGDQAKVIVAWCNKAAKKVDFLTAIDQHDPDNWGLDRQAVMLSYFMRRFSLVRYPEQLYLDMVSFIKYDDQLTEVIPFVEKAIGYDKTREQVLENLKHGVVNSKSLSDQLVFIKENKLKEAKSPLIKYLFGPDRGNKYEALSLFLELGGDTEKLKSVLKQSDGYFRGTLIDQFVKVKSPYIGKFLKKHFKKESDSDEKLKLSRYLIRLQNEKALDYYIKYTAETGMSPDDSSPGNPLYFLNKPKFVNRVLDLYRLAQEPKYYSDNFRDLRSISSNALQNIALYGSGFPEIKTKVKNWIRSKRIKTMKKNGTLPPNLITDLYFYLESYSRQFYSRVEMLTLPEAIAVYNEIHKNNRKG